MTRIAVTFLIIFFALYGCTTTIQSRGTPVAPGELFAGEYINVRAPSSEGWQRMQLSGSVIAFGKRGQATSESFIAQVMMSNLAPTKTPEEFEALIKAVVDKGTDPSRFDVQQASFKYSGERSYPCVRYQSVAQDKKPKGSRSPLLLEADGLYCRHPVRQETGFAVIYSHRGENHHTNLRSEAESFIQGVQVPDK